MTDKSEVQLRRLQVRRFKLMQDFPFYAILLQKLDLKIDDSCPTAYTNGRVIAFNTEYAGKLSDAELTYDLCHETRHITDMHLVRGNTRKADNEMYNRAADYRINWDLHHAGIGSMPEWSSLYDEKYNASWTTDMIYDDLMNKSEEEKDKIRKKGDSCDDHSRWGEACPLSEDEVMSRIIDAVQKTDQMDAQKLGGKCSGASSVPDYIRELLNEYLAPQVDWKEAVVMTTSEYSKQDKSWAKCNRRYVYQNVYMPYYAKGDKAVFCIAIDTSGSISAQEAHVAISECKAAVEALDDYELYILNFSDEVHQCRKFTPSDDFDYELRGSGGTDLSCITDYLVKEEIEVDCMFVITDGRTSRWPDEDFCEDTTFLCTSDVVAPYGETVKLLV